MPSARNSRVPLPPAPKFISALALGLLVAVAAPGSAPAAQPKVPDGFTVVTVATVPAVNYPCQLATTPDGGLFVAEDPMDQVGPYESDNGRILLFRAGQPPVVFAQGFRAIFGMAWHDGSLYVMNMPRLTVLTDTNGDGRADKQKELFTNLGPGPKPGALNDHIVSGIQFGMDGLLYISVGDKGVPGAKGPDGRSVQLQGGGTLRCRPDGTGLEIFTSGTRNHLEPNLDARDTLFTYDNTDDGDGWWTRVTHHVDGGYYGYPYDYHNHTDRMLPRMSEYGGGSPCGGVVYREDAWPEKYRGMAFWAEWGKGKVQGFRFEPDGSTYKVAEVVDFAVPDGLENFHPIDLALSYDGKVLYVADWSMGGWGNKTERVGRVFAISYTGETTSPPRGTDADPIDKQIKQLSHPAYNERMRAQAALIKKGKEAFAPVTAALANPKTDPVAARHLVWIVDALAGGRAAGTAPLVAALKSKVADVRAQAARALGERAATSALEPLIALLADRDLSVRLQAVIALGRISDAKAIPALLPQLVSPDKFIAFSARQALRRINRWQATATAGLASRDPKVRTAVLAAMELVYQPEAASILAHYASEARNPADERAKAVVYLAEVFRKPKPWDGEWWGTRPSQGKPPAKIVDWEGTPVAQKTIRQCLTDAQAPVRMAAIKGTVAAGDRAILSTLHRRFSAEKDPAVTREMIMAFGAMDDKDALPILIRTLRAPKVADAVREAALASIETIGGDAAASDLVELLARPDLPASLQPKVMAMLGKFKAKAAVPILMRKVATPTPEIRLAAIEALGQIGESDGVTTKLLPLVDDKDPAVRKAAITTLGQVHDAAAVPALLKATESEPVRFEASLALANTPDPRALQVYLRGLVDKSPELRKAAATALGAIREQAVPVLDQLAARRELMPGQVRELQKIFATAEPLKRWSVIGPFKAADEPFSPEKPIDFRASFTGRKEQPVHWIAAGKQVSDKGVVDLEKLYSAGDEQAAYGYADLESATDRKAQLVLGSDDTLTIWLNGKQVYNFQESRGYEPESARVDVDLVKGLNRFVIKCGNHGGTWKFSVAVTSPTEYAFLKSDGAAVGGFDPEAYRAEAMKGSGKADRGRTLFLDPKGVGCIKCHAVGGQGGSVGPELSSVGTKYSRDELITSVLFPSARISSGYEAITVATSDGRVVTGILKADTPEAIELADSEGKQVRIAKDMVEEQKPSTVSIMPSGLAEGLSAQDFADLIAYLETLKQPSAASPASSSSAASKAARGH